MADPAAGVGTRRAVLLAAALSWTVAGCKLENGNDAARNGRSPFTGEKGAGDRVLAVKVDNVEAARPQTGLEKADIVYTEQVEAGLSRILAVFSSRLPSSVGPVRSARESDLELLRQFGRPALAYSGAQSKLRPALEAAPLTPLTPRGTGAGYVREQDRPAPHNLYLRPDRALRAAPGATAPGDIGFRFGAAPEGGRETARHSVEYPAARFSFAWSAGRGRWLVSMDGAPARTSSGEQLGAATVVVQRVTVRSSGLRDSGGSVSPYTETVGSGRALVLRDGKAYDARWSRPSGSAGTTYTGGEGRRMPFARGPVWVVLAPSDRTGR